MNRLAQIGTTITHSSSWLTSVMMGKSLRVAREVWGEA